MHTTKRQWIRIILLAVLTILCCNSSVLAADTTHYADADRHESHSHVAAPDTGKDNATVATLHETARVCSQAPTRNTSVSVAHTEGTLQKPESLQSSKNMLRRLSRFRQHSVAPDNAFAAV